MRLSKGYNAPSPRRATAAKMGRAMSKPLRELEPLLELLGAEPWPVGSWPVAVELGTGSSEGPQVGHPNAEPRDGSTADGATLDGATTAVSLRRAVAFPNSAERVGNGAGLSTAAEVLAEILPAARKRPLKQKSLYTMSCL